MNCATPQFQRPADDGAIVNLFAYSAGGPVFAQGAVLTVVSGVPPAITQQPTAQAWSTGRIPFSAGAGGTPTLANVAPGCVGAGFMAIATNAAGRAESDSVPLSAPVVVASLIAGAPGVPGSADGSGGDARFNTPNYLAVARDGGIAIGDFGNSTVRVVVGTAVRTLAGSPGVFAFDDGTGSAYGTGSGARLRNPNGLAIDASDNVFVVDRGNRTVRRITPAGDVTTFAGTAGQFGSAGGVGAAARFATPSGLAIDGSGQLCVVDQGHHTVRKIRPAGEVSTVAGTAGVSGFVDGAGDTVRRVSPSGVVETVVGVSGDGSTLRLGADPRLRNARGVWAVSANGLLVNADQALIQVRLP